MRPFLTDPLVHHFLLTSLPTFAICRFPSCKLHSWLFQAFRQGIFPSQHISSFFSDFYKNLSIVECEMFWLHPILSLTKLSLLCLVRSAPDAAPPAGAPGAPGAPGADGAPAGAPPGPPNTSSNRRLQQTQAQVEEVSCSELLGQNAFCVESHWCKICMSNKLQENYHLRKRHSHLFSSFTTPPPQKKMLSHPSWIGLGGGYHAGECGQGFGKGPEAFRAGWQSGRSPSWSLPVWKLRSQAKKQVLVEELQGGRITVAPLHRLVKQRETYGIIWLRMNKFLLVCVLACRENRGQHRNLLMSCCRALKWYLRGNGRKASAIVEFSL